jgi:hypothetical protein
LKEVYWRKGLLEERVTGGGEVMGGKDYLRKRIFGPRGYSRKLLLEEVVIGGRG